MKDKMDELLKTALTPDTEPDTELNQRLTELISENERIKEMKPKKMIPAAAIAAIMGVLVLCPVGAIAANKIIKEKFTKGNSTVTEHSFSKGNPDYVDDDAIIADSEDPTVEDINERDGGEDDNWIRMRSELVNGKYTNTRYYYDDYSLAITDSGFENWLTESYELSDPACYCETTADDLTEAMKSLDANFKYSGKAFALSMDNKTADQASDLAYSIQLNESSNFRTYTSASGLDFDLVDDIGSDRADVITYTIIETEGFRGSLEFLDMTEDEIHVILDSVSFVPAPDYEPEVCEGAETEAVEDADAE